MSTSLRSKPTELDCTLRDTVQAVDREAVRQIVERTGFFRPDEVAIAVELVDERLARGAASSYEFVFAERNGEVIGYACYGEIGCTLGSYDLYWIAVEPSVQRGGIGRRLLAEVEHLIAAAGGRRIYIETSSQPKYVATRAFYERNGYECEARLRDFYAPGDDRLTYFKAFQGRIQA